jgi:glycogen operon protein
MDFTGCGNTLKMVEPRVLQLIMDSLRYWVTEMHVDGFRFDLASTLARELHDVDRLSAFFDLIQQDPVVSRVKLIAEPWDVGEGGYQVGNFPTLWSEWNGRYRDLIRDFWRGEDRNLGEFAARITGSSDLYEWSGRRPFASINFVTAHDGFTLNDLVSYNEKHNEANGEDNRDGTDDNRSWNCGVEGTADDADILALRATQRRNFLATLLLSQGIPMLLGGDEMARTQRGNNNAYCQDNEISWYDWSLAEANADQIEFTRRLIELRFAHRIFRRRRWFEGRSIRGSEEHDIAWFTPQATQMTEEDWNAGHAKSISVFLNGQSMAEPDARGERVVDDTFLWLVNADYQPLVFTLPSEDWGSEWTRVFDTSEPRGGFDEEGVIYGAGEELKVKARSQVLLKRA